MNEPICVKCPFAVWGEDGWGICQKAKPEQNNIARFLPEVNCPIDRHLTQRAPDRLWRSLKALVYNTYVYLRVVYFYKNGGR